MRNNTTNIDIFHIFIKICFIILGLEKSKKNRPLLRVNNYNTRIHRKFEYESTLGHCNFIIL